MKDVCLVFPGQGAQKVGMGQSFYEGCASSKAIFDQADQVLGNNLSDVMFSGPQETLTSTAYCQPAILTMSLAALAALKESSIWSQMNIKYTAGLSLGEYSALAAAGNLSLEDALKLVEARSSLMEDATQQAKGAMAAIIGFNQEQLLAICADTGAEVANFNAPDQIVITGHADKVEAASAKIKEAGAKRVIPLDVSGAFHSSLMAPAADQFAPVVANVDVSMTNIDVVSNVDGQISKDVDTLKDKLPKQIISSVQWVKSVEFMVDQGILDFIEIGPGKVLRGLIRKIAPDARVQNVETLDDIQHISFT